MKLSSKTQALYDLIAPAVAVCDVDLWGIEFMPQGKKSLLRIYIDKTTDESAEPVLNEDGEVEHGRGVGVQDCVRVTHQVNGVLDVHDPIAGEYALEVSSPGWDRPFFSLAQMSHYVGQTVSVRLIHAVANRRKAQAKLLAVDLEQDKIILDIDGQSVEIEADNIDKANLVYQD